MVNVQPVRADVGTIYIKADGSVEPPAAPLSTADNTTYTLTDNITSNANGIVIERDNVTLDGAGYTVTGSGSGNGTTLTDRSNVTIRNMTIKNFGFGIWLSSSSNNGISGNNITANSYYGIWLYSSSNNTITGNDMTNNIDGILLYSSSNNSISGNNITNNYYGIYFVFPLATRCTTTSSTTRLKCSVISRQTFGITAILLAETTGATTTAQTCTVGLIRIKLQVTE
jgi:parallel beta-helix repeat protein